MFQKLVSGGKAVARRVGQVVQSPAALVGVGLSVVSVASHATLDANATAAFTSISGSVTDVLAAVWPVVGAVAAGFVTIKLFKRGSAKV